MFSFACGAREYYFAVRFASLLESRRVTTPSPRASKCKRRKKRRWLKKSAKRRVLIKSVRKSDSWVCNRPSLFLLFFFFFSPRDLRFVVLIEVHFWCLLKAIESRELNLLTTIVDLGGTHRFTNCRSSRPSCSVALPFDLSWKVHQILNIENDFFPSFFFFRCNGALIFALCDGRWNRQKCYVQLRIISPFSWVKIFSLKEKLTERRTFLTNRFETKGIEEALISLIEITLSRNNLETSNNIPY